MKTFIVTCLLLAANAVAHAQTNYAIPWFKIAGGGAMQSTGGVYALSGTIGQPDAGRVASTNDSFRLEGGFWGIAVQQAGYPVLGVTRSGTNALISWVTAETGFVLQTVTNLATPTAWSDAGFAPAVSGSTNVVTAPLNPAVKTFFRLRRP
ncbi:MAG: hypothetical protein HY301_00730 [Verrucomicrobia bacterium]|nr:hypothetical protein [Verrucomicrobiota bacterium]